MVKASCASWISSRSAQNTHQHLRNRVFHRVSGFATSTIMFAHISSFWLTHHLQAIRKRCTGRTGHRAEMGSKCDLETMTMRENDTRCGRRQAMGKTFERENKGGMQGKVMDKLRKDAVVAMVRSGKVQCQCVKAVVGRCASELKRSSLLLNIFLFIHGLMHRAHQIHIPCIRPPFVVAPGERIGCSAHYRIV